MKNLYFVPQEEIKHLEEITGFSEEEILSDFLLYCDQAKSPVNLATWTEYKDETENQF